MKKLLLLLLPFVVASAVSISAQAQNWAHFKYTLFGEYKDVGFNQNKQSLIINPSDVECGQLIFLEGKNSIESFAKSLVAMREEYINLKKINSSTTTMSTSFEKFSLFWKYLKKTTGGACSDIHPIYYVDNSDGEILRYAVIREIIEDVENSKNTAKLFLVFRSESEIQSLIDILNICLERLGVPFSSQSPSASSQNSNVKKMSDYDKEFDEAERKFGRPLVFEYAHAKNKAFYGIIYPGEMEKLKAVCFYLFSGSMDYRYYHVIPSEEICDMWIKTLTDMKELFIKNDKIAKDNNVIADVDKDVSDKFTFLRSKDLFGLRVGSYDVLNTRTQLFFSTHMDDYIFKVRYLYSNGASSMILYFSYDSNNPNNIYEVYRFDSVKDFDDFINAITWSNYMKAFNVQAQKVKDKQALEAKKKQQQALFD